MGISGTKNMFWKTTTITFDAAISTIASMIDTSSNSALDASIASGEAAVAKREAYTVAVDANLIAYKYIGDGSSISPVGSVLKITRAFNDKGFDVIVVSDNPTKRHHSKRATIQRVSKQKKATIQAKIKRHELHSIQAGNDSAEKASQLQATMKKLSAAENAMSKMFPPNFADALQIAIENYKQEMGFGENSSKVTYKVAPTQADPCVAKLVVDGAVDTLVSNDGVLL